MGIVKSVPHMTLGHILIHGYDQKFALVTKNYYW